MLYVTGVTWEARSRFHVKWKDIWPWWTLIFFTSMHIKQLDSKLCIFVKYWQFEVCLASLLHVIHLGSLINVCYRESWPWPCGRFERKYLSRTSAVAFRDLRSGWSQTHRLKFNQITNLINISNAAWRYRKCLMCTCVHDVFEGSMLPTFATICWTPDEIGRIVITQSLETIWDIPRNWLGHCSWQCGTIWDISRIDLMCSSQRSGTFLVTKYYIIWEGSRSFIRDTCCRFAGRLE